MTPGTAIYFNPRGPCGPRRNYAIIGKSHKAFQSSRSLRTATIVYATFYPIVDISILAVLADRDNTDKRERLVTDISILAVLADRDTGACPGCALPSRFQSSRSLRTATMLFLAPVVVAPQISILAVLADRDHQLWQYSSPGCEISILAVLADRDGGEASLVKK